MSNLTDLTKVIPADNSHLNFIYNSFLKSKRDSIPSTRVGNDIYFIKESVKLTEVISRPNVALRVLVVLDDPTNIVGWTIVETEGVEITCHFIYIKFPYRKMGFGKLLLPKVTHHTHLPKSKLVLSSIYDPYRW